jgi:hypothetical protein
MDRGPAGPCPIDRLRVEGERSYSHPYLIEGCGHRGAFLEQVETVDGGAGQITRYEHYVNLSAPLPPRLAQGDLARWRDLVVQGALDLRCPEEQITPDFVWDRTGIKMFGPRFPVAEGCGKRAIYDRHRGPPFCDPTIVPIDP